MAKDFISYLSETVDSVSNRAEKDKDIQKMLGELNSFIEKQNRGGTPDRVDLGDTPIYERVETEKLTAEELKALGEESLAGHKSGSEAAIESEIAALEKKLTADKELAQKTAADRTQQVDKAYAAAKKDVDDDVLKRGLARSSIAVNKRAELAGAAAGAADKIGGELANELYRLETEIAGLSQKREKALDDFNIAYAAKLTQTIRDLTAEQEKKTVEAIKYNNTLSEKEFADKAAKAEKEANTYAKELDNAKKEREITGAQDKYAALYQKMTGLLDGLNGADARKLVMENAIFRDSLNDSYYYKLYDKYAK